MEIEQIQSKNVEELAGLFIELWPDGIFEEELKYCQRILRSKKKICFLAKHQMNYTGFIYMSLRSDYVEGTSTSPVAYIKGLYVKPDHRKKGIAGKLIDKGEEWGKNKGCSEMASDTDQLYPQG